MGLGKRFCYRCFRAHRIFSVFSVARHDGTGMGPLRWTHDETYTTRSVRSRWRLRLDRTGSHPGTDTARATTPAVANIVTASDTGHAGSGLAHDAPAGSRGRSKRASDLRHV